LGFGEFFADGLQYTVLLNLFFYSDFAFSKVFNIFQPSISGVHMGGKGKIVVFSPLFVAIFFAAPLINGLLTPSAFASQSPVKTVGVKIYWERRCVNEVSSIDWGAVEAGLFKNATVYVKNMGDVAITLSLSTANWNPSSASSYITLGWDYDGQPVKRAKVIPIKLTLSIPSQSIMEITDFSFDIIITGTG